MKSQAKRMTKIDEYLYSENPLAPSASAACVLMLMISCEGRLLVFQGSPLVL